MREDGDEEVDGEGARAAGHISDEQNERTSTRGWFCKCEDAWRCAPRFQKAAEPWLCVTGSQSLWGTCEKVKVKIQWETQDIGRSQRQEISDKATGSQ